MCWVGGGSRPTAGFGLGSYKLRVVCKASQQKEDSCGWEVALAGRDWRQEGGLGGNTQLKEEVLGRRGNEEVLESCAMTRVRNVDPALSREKREHHSRHELRTKAVNQLCKA